MVTLQNTDGGLIPYVQKGGKLPPVELIKDYQAAVKVFCDNSETERFPSGTYTSRGDQKVHKSSFYYNESTRQIAGFNKETGDIITAGKYKRQAFDRFFDTKSLGQL